MLMSPVSPRIFTSPALFTSREMILAERVKVVSSAVKSPVAPGCKRSSSRMCCWTVFILVCMLPLIFGTKLTTKVYLCHHKDTKDTKAQREDISLCLGVLGAITHLHMKLEASSVLPEPLYAATCG